MRLVGGWRRSAARFNYFFRGCVRCIVHGNVFSAAWNAHNTLPYSKQNIFGYLSFHNYSYIFYAAACNAAAFSGVLYLIHAGNRH